MISPSFVRICVLALLFCFHFNSSIASEKVQVAAQPTWLYKVNVDLSKKPVTKSISDGYYLELSDHQVNLLNNCDYTHYIRHIVNESGVQNASEVSVTFSPSFEQVIFHKVTLIRDGAVISEIKASQIKVVQEETDASDFQYNGLKRAFVLLKDVRKDDRIEVAYSVVGFNPVFANKYTDKIYFGNTTAITNYFETVITPQNRKLFLHAYNKVQAPVEQDLGNLHIYHWSNPPVKIWESQPGVPSWFNNYPYVAISEFANWEEVVNWGLQIFNNYQYVLPSDLKNKIEKWRTIAKDDKEKFASIAIQFVQDQVRYLGLELGEYTHQPHSPGEVYQHRFGDCKDKALLLAAILQNENIPAYVALVSTDKTEKVPEMAPGPNQFDHAIVAIERPSGYIYVDATDTRQRGDLLHLFIPAYGYALLLKKGESSLQHITPGSSNETNIIERLEVKFIDTSHMSVSTTYTGGTADVIRSSFAGTSISELEDNYIKYYAKKFDGIQQSKPIDVTDDSIKNEIIVKETYDIPTLWHTSDKGEESFSFFAQPIYDRFPNPVNAYKDAPIALTYPLNLHYKMIIDMPESWVFEFDELHIKNDSYQFDFVPASVSGHISASYFLKTFKDNIPQSELLKYKSDYKTIDKIIEFELYKNNQSSPSSSTSAESKNDGNINWLMVGFAFIIVASLAALLKTLDKRRLNISYPHNGSRQIGGWLVILGVTLFVGGLFQILEFVTSHYFSNASWITLHQAGGTKLQLIFTLELALSLLWICGIFAAIYWFMNRRDIFPQMFMAYVGSLLAGQLLLAILYGLVPYPEAMGKLTINYLVAFFRTLVYGVIWVTFVVKSERVKETFVE